MMQMVDSASAHTDASFLADKRAETTLTAFKVYHAMVECQTRWKLLCIRTDEGTEFCNTLWATYPAEHGIIHEPTMAYSFESNDVIERSNRTVIERTQVLLNDSSLPLSMWCEVAATIIYLKDFIPTTRCPDTMPYEDWRGLCPDVSHLRFSVPSAAPPMQRSRLRSGGGEAGCALGQMCSYWVLWQGLLPPP